MRHGPLTRIVLDVRWPYSLPTQLPPSYLAPRLAHSYSSLQSTQVISSAPDIPPPPSQTLASKSPKKPLRSISRHLPSPQPPRTSNPIRPSPSKPPVQNASSTFSQITPKPTPPTAPGSPDPPLVPLDLHPTLQSLLPVLGSQSPLYIRAHIHRVPFLLTAGDTLRLPFRLHDVHPGDILRLNRATVLGSRDYTLKPGFANVPPGPVAASAMIALEDAALRHATLEEATDGSELLGGLRRSAKATRYIDERLFECRARVISVDSTPTMVKVKTKRRQRHVRRVISKHNFTVLRVMEVKVKRLEELELATAT